MFILHRNVFFVFLGMLIPGMSVAQYFDGDIGSADSIATYHYNEGYKLLAWNKDSAMVQFQEAIEKDSTYFEPYEMLYTHYIYRDKKIASSTRQTIIELMRQLVKVDSTNDRYWFNLGRAVALSPYGVQFKSVDTEVLFCFSKAIKLNPNVAQYYWERGCEYRSFRKDYKRAIEDIKKAISLKSSYTYWINLAACYRDLGDYEAQIAVYDEAIKLFPNTSNLEGYKEEALKKLKSSKKVKK